MKNIPNGFQIVKPKNPDDHYTIIPNILFQANNLNATDKCVIAHLLSHKDGFTVTKQFISKGIGMDWKSVSRSFQRLIEKGIISFENNILLIHFDKITDRTEFHRTKRDMEKCPMEKCPMEKCPDDVSLSVQSNIPKRETDYTKKGDDYIPKRETNNTNNNIKQDEKKQDQKQDYASGSVLNSSVWDLDELFENDLPKNLSSHPQQDVLADDKTTKPQKDVLPNDPASRPNAEGGADTSQVMPPSVRTESRLRAAPDNQGDTPYSLPDKDSGMPPKEVIKGNPQQGITINKNINEFKKEFNKVYNNPDYSKFKMIFDANSNWKDYAKILMKLPLSTIAYHVVENEKKNLTSRSDQSANTGEWVLAHFLCKYSSVVEGSGLWHHVLYCAENDKNILKNLNLKGE